MRRKNESWPRWMRRGGVDLKTAIAMIFAVGGLSWATVALLGGRGKPDPSGPRIIASALDEQGNAVEPEYTAATSDRQLEAAAMQIENIVSSEAMTVLGVITASKGSPVGVSEAVVNAFIPLVKGDQDAFWEAIAAMGGKVPGEIDGEHRMFRHLKNEFAGSKIDFSRIRVRKHEAAAPAERGARMTREVDDEGGDGPAMQTNRMEMRPESIFPDAPQVSDPSAIEVTIPVQPKGEELESIFLLVLTWNSDAKLWQPATYGVVKNRLIDEEG